MVQTLKAEFRKLLTVRSTYVITILVVILISFIAFYVEGWRLNPAALHQSNQFSSDVTGALNLTIFGAIVAILLMTHEYRYNTIMYTLTSSNSRTKVLVSKFITVSIYAVFLAILIGVLSPTMTYLGIHLHGHVLVPQTMHYWNLIWRSLFYSWGYAMAGLLLALWTRSQVASIVALFLIPTLADELLGLLLKHNTVYLPFNALNQIIDGSGRGGGSTSSNLSASKAAGVYAIYVVVGWIIAWILFLRRDATT
ncbi:MAG TPA: ABC transporter permease [Candidatus Saccharimonadales bacterium]|nr:ABC transporter permease [Candidatus Saccharimonadales bacterium]